MNATSRMQLEASTSSSCFCTGHVRSVSGRCSVAKLRRSQSYNNPATVRVHIDYSHSIQCRAAASDTQADNEWSSKLLSLTKKKRKRDRARDKTAVPDIDGSFAPGAGFFDGDEDWDADESRVSGSGMVADTKRLPAVVRCFDTARVYVKSGDGGAGCVAFRREPFVEKGGPNGGNGGRGGHVWAVADEGLNSLLPFRNQAHFRAQNGSSGRPQLRSVLVNQPSHDAPGCRFGFFSLPWCKLYLLPPYMPAIAFTSNVRMATSSTSPLCTYHRAKPSVVPRLHRVANPCIWWLVLALNGYCIKVLHRIC
jgi:hypothetical protein